MCGSHVPLWFPISIIDYRNVCEMSLIFLLGDSYTEYTMWEMCVSRQHQQQSIKLNMFIIVLIAKQLRALKKPRRQQQNVRQQEQQ